MQMRVMHMAKENQGHWERVNAILLWAGKCVELERPQGVSASSLDYLLVSVRLPFECNTCGQRYALVLNGTLPNRASTSLTNGRFTTVDVEEAQPTEASLFAVDVCGFDVRRYAPCVAPQIRVSFTVRCATGYPGSTTPDPRSGSDRE